MRSLKTLSLLLVSALVAPVVSAQTPTTTAKTDTDYGVAAISGTASGADSKPKDTTITRTSPLSVLARAGGAYASSRAYVSTNSVYTYEYASVYIASTSKTTNDAAGTTTSKTGAIGDAHALTANLPIMAEARGQLVIYWSRYVLGKGVSVKSVVNVGGKDVATFTESDANKTVRVDVVGSSSGVDVKITNSGKAAPGAVNERSYYSTAVRVYFQANVGSSKCTFTAFGKTCGLTLEGSALSRTIGTTVYHTVTLDVDGMGENEIGLLGVGPTLGTAVILPGGCELLVDPKVIAPIRYRNTLYFRNKDPLDVNIQAVSLTLTNKGVTIESSNGLNVKCPGE